MQSMTGFGRGTATSDYGTATVEISSVNRRQLEMNIQGLRDLPELETECRKLVADSISRGRMQINISYLPAQQEIPPVHTNLPLAHAINDALHQVAKHIGQPLSLTAEDLLRNPDIFDYSASTTKPEQARESILPAVAEALEKLVQMRTSEGTYLAEDLAERIKLLEEIHEKISELAPNRPEYHREQLEKRFSTIGITFEAPEDQERLMRELALFADRCDITEELTRLSSHFNSFRDYLNGDEPAGRSLDFLCQELNREWNTIGSKANDAELAQLVVRAKTELEKIREQVQNLE